MTILPPGTRAHRTVVVEDLEEGMILAEAVHDALGRLLIQQDTALTSRHLRGFQLWGIGSVKIVGAAPGEPEPPPISPEILARAEALVLTRFRHNDPAHPLVAAVLRICVLREARRLAGEGLVHA